MFVSCVYYQDSRRITNATLNYAIGLDIRLTDSFDLRAFEFGADAPTGSASSKIYTGFAFIDAGVVYHFPYHPKNP